jgi:hypothetical protein
VRRRRPASLSMPVAWIVAIAGLAWVPFWLGTLDRSLPGTDHALSVTPEELRQLKRFPIIWKYIRHG